MDNRQRAMQRLYGAVIPRFRRQRMRLFSRLLPSTPETTVLDVGGGPMNWQWCEPMPRVTTLNLRSGDVVADGRRLPFRDGSFDVVFSNSVIEHVGSRMDQEAFACEIGRVGRRYFVQTPNRNFPIEPHFMTPLVQFLPVGLRARLARNFTLWGLITRPAPDTVASSVRSIRLLTPSDMRRLFPDARLHRERLFGLAKSLVAVRGETHT
jgi:SAM-dependent methyltransferase